MKQGGKIRIIGGLWKRTPLPVLDSEGLRPTGDRQRETIFNWLNHLFGGEFSDKRSRDMFAGTGALSFEMASRGAENAVLLEKNRAAAKLIEQSKEKLNADNIHVFCDDSLKDSKAEEFGPYDIIFIDPPFALNLQEKAIQKAVPLLNFSGLIYVESPTEISDDFLDSFGLTAVKRSKGGASHLLLAQKTENKK